MVINPIVGVYIPIIRIPIKGGMTIPNIATFDHGTFVSWWFENYSDWWLNHPSEKYARQNGSFPQVWVKIKNIWNHHPVFLAIFTDVGYSKLAQSSKIHGKTCNENVKENDVSANANLSLLRFWKQSEKPGKSLQVRLKQRSLPWSWESWKLGFWDYRMHKSLTSGNWSAQ